MNPAFPNEVWLHIFSNIDHSPTLLAVTLTSQLFGKLAAETLMKVIVWSSENKANNCLAFLKNNTHLTRFPRSLSVHPDAVSKTWPQIWRPAASLRNLGHLSLRHLTLSTDFYDFLVRAPPALTHLTLDRCLVEDPPASFSSPADAPIPITHLSLGLTYFPTCRNFAALADLFEREGQCPKIAFTQELPLLHSLTADLWTAHFQPCLAQLTSLTSTGLFVKSHSMVLWEIQAIMRRTPRLLHLDISSTLPNALFSVAPLRHTAPALASFIGPSTLSVPFLRACPTLISLELCDPIENIDSVLELMHSTNARTLEKVELRVLTWDDEIMRAIAHCLPACRELRLSFAFSQPTENFLLTMGAVDLARMPHLRTLHLRGFLPASKYLEPRLALKRHPLATAPAQEDCIDYLAAWKKYNRNLNQVCFEEGQVWGKVDGRWRLVVSK